MTRELNEWDLTGGAKLWSELDTILDSSKIRAEKRIGIDYAKHCKEYLWRFVHE
jgi:3-methyladenine DNA glycosylase Mpg